MLNGLAFTYVILIERRHTMTENEEQVQDALGTLSPPMIIIFEQWGIDGLTKEVNKFLAQPSVVVVSVQYAVDKEYRNVMVVYRKV